MYNKYIKMDNKKKLICILCKYNNNEIFCIFKKKDIRINSIMWLEIRR